MKIYKPACYRCSIKNEKKLKLYWRSFMGTKVKVFYCDNCASNILPGQQPITKEPTDAKRTNRKQN